MSTIFRDNVRTPRINRDVKKIPNKNDSLKNFNSMLSKENFLKSTPHQDVLNACFGLEHTDTLTPEFEEITSELSKNISHNVITSFFGANVRITRSSIDMAAMVFVNMYGHGHCFNEKGNFKKDSFITYLKQYKIPVSESDISSGYFDKIKYNISNNKILFNNTDDIEIKDYVLSDLTSNLNNIKKLLELHNCDNKTDNYNTLLIKINNIPTFGIITIPMAETIKEKTDEINELFANFIRYDTTNGIIKAQNIILLIGNIIVKLMALNINIKTFENKDKSEVELLRQQYEQYLYDNGYNYNYPVSPITWGYE